MHSSNIYISPLSLSPSYTHTHTHTHTIEEESSDGNISGEPPPDQKLTKRDIHSLNEQRRRDLIKVNKLLTKLRHLLSLLARIQSAHRFSPNMPSFISW